MTGPSQNMLNARQTMASLRQVWRESGVDDLQGIGELLYLLFLKHSEQDGCLPAGLWRDILHAPDPLAFYHARLMQLAAHGLPLVRTIFGSASSVIRNPEHLQTLHAAIDALHEEDPHRGLCTYFDGLLAEQVIARQGRHRTPQLVIDCMIACLKPSSSEVVLDPAAGTGEFILAVHESLRSLYPAELLPAHRLVALEQDAATQRLLCLNLLLHGIATDGYFSTDDKLPWADIILGNPSAGFHDSGPQPFHWPMSFLGRIIRSLRAGGRAAIIVPDSALFAEGPDSNVRTELLERCDLHTILRLPRGIFKSAPRAGTNVLFFRGADAADGSTRVVWVYDMRLAPSSSGPAEHAYAEQLAEFVSCFHVDPLVRKEQTRWRRITRQAIADRGDDLNLAWTAGGDLIDQEDAPLPLEIPARWKRVPLGDLVTSMDNGVKIRATADGDQGVPVPVLRVHNITEDGRLSLDKIQHVKLDAPTPDRYRLAVGDIVVNRVNSKRLIGKTCLIPDDSPFAAYESKNIRIRVNQKLILPAFLYEWLQTEIMRRRLSAAGRGTTVPTISQKQLRRFLVPLPSLDEQRRIAETLAADRTPAQRAAAFRGELTDAVPTA